MFIRNSLTPHVGMHKWSFVYKQLINENMEKNILKNDLVIIFNKQCSYKHSSMLLYVLRTML